MPLFVHHNNFTKIDDSRCDGWTSAGNSRCQAASFQTGVSGTANNCFLMGVGVSYNAASGWESVTVTSTKLL